VSSCSWPSDALAIRSRRLLPVSTMAIRCEHSIRHRRRIVDCGEFDRSQCLYHTHWWIRVGDVFSRLVSHGFG
jgi:hypothetical protein